MPRSLSNPCSSISASMRLRSSCQRFTGPASPNRSCPLIALSNAAHTITRECVKNRSAPRISQIPLSLRAQFCSVNVISARCTGHAWRPDRTPFSRASCSATITSPITSAWYWSTAPLPIRTGEAPS